jgi:nitrate reductase alpha subunit
MQTGFRSEEEAPVTAVDKRPNSENTAWANRYRDKWRWDKVAWGSHCVDCYPTNCTYRVYVRDGRVVREEPSGHLQTVQEGVPDMNPTGCQKGACWSQMLYGKDRVLHPLRRIGERGEG